MTDEKRACIAAIAYVAISHNTSNAIYDYHRSIYVNLGIQCNGSLFNVYDYDRSGYLGGYLPNIFDYPSGYYIQLSINGRNFTGFDYETSTYYNGFVNGRSISVYDYEHNQYYLFGM